MNVAGLMPHYCDIMRNNVPVTDNTNRDAYGQPRVSAQVISSTVPCSFKANIARNLFTTDVLKSAGSVLATLLIDADAVPDGIHLGDLFTNVQDRRGNVLTAEVWFSYRISPYSDAHGVQYYNVMIARDEAGPRN